MDTSCFLIFLLSFFALSAQNFRHPKFFSNVPTPERIFWGNYTCYMCCKKSLKEFLKIHIKHKFFVEPKQLFFHQNLLSLNKFHILVGYFTISARLILFSRSKNDYDFRMLRISLKRTDYRFFVNRSAIFKSIRCIINFYIDSRLWLIDCRHFLIASQNFFIDWIWV